MLIKTKESGWYRVKSIQKKVKMGRYQQKGNDINWGPIKLNQSLLLVTDNKDKSKLKMTSKTIPQKM